MDEQRYQRAVVKIAEETASGAHPDNSNVYVYIQSSRDPISLPRMRGFETFSTPLQDGAHLVADARTGRVLCPEGVSLLSLLFRRSLFRRLGLSVAHSDSFLFTSLTEEMPSEHTPAWREASVEDRERIRDLLRLILVTYAERQQDWRVQTEALVLAFFAIRQSSEHESASERSPDSVVAMVLQEITSHPEDVSLTSLASRYSYSPSYLSSLLSSKLGKTFSELVSAARMQRARMLLQNTELPVRQVAQMVGYAGTSAFYRGYKAFFGRSPGSEREKRDVGGSDQEA